MAEIRDQTIILDIFSSHKPVAVLLLTWKIGHELTVLRK